MTKILIPPTGRVDKDEDVIRLAKKHGIYAVMLERMKEKPYFHERIGKYVWLFAGDKKFVCLFFYVTDSPKEDENGWVVYHWRVFNEAQRKIAQDSRDYVVDSFRLGNAGHE